MQIITADELSKKIKVNRSSMRVFLCRFEKYAIKGKRYQYILNIDFLTELKHLFQKKMHDRNGRYFTQYYRTVRNIKKLMEEIDKGE